jgi:methionine-rich copper-binding protein CopC
MRTLNITLALASGLLLSTLAQAHPKLLSSTPAEGADGAAPDKIELHFSENLLTRFSGAKLVMTEMPGMAHSPMPMKARVSAGSDPKSMLVTPSRRCPPAPTRSSGARCRQTRTRSPATSRSK